MRYMTVQLLFLLALGSCASPPKPPTVDESRKRPANASVEVELQSCRSALQNTRIAANESQRAAAAAVASATQLAQAVGAPSSRNVVYAVLFPYGGTRAQVGSAEAARLVEEARGAPLIVLRGRTDGMSATTAESRIARQRAESVQALLLQAGIEPARIRTTWQPAGDHAADNDLPGGRVLNRRVEIEIYHAAPQAPVTLVSSEFPTGDRLLPHPPSARTSMEASFTDDRRPGGTVEPANRVAVAKQHFQAPEEPAVERFELRDPFAEVTYRTRTIAEMAAKADSSARLAFMPLRPMAGGRRW